MTGYLYHALRFLTAAVLAYSAMSPIWTAGIHPGRVPLGPVSVPIVILASIAEILAAALLLRWRPTRADGLGLLLWSGSMAIVRDARGSACGCLDALGGYPWMVASVATAVLATGLITALRTKFRYDWRDSLTLAGGTLMLVACVQVASSPRQPGAQDDIHVEAPWQDEQPPSRVVVRNESLRVLKLERITPSCDCVKLDWSTQRIEAGQTVEVALEWVKPIPDGVIPLLDLSGRLADESWTSIISIER